MDFTCLSPAERLVAERAILFARAAKAKGDAAPYGQILNHLEQAVLLHGREFMRQTLQDIAQEKINEIESDKEIPCSSCTKKKKEHKR